MKERPIVFGDPVPLVGIVSEPPVPAGARVGCLLLNAGLVHRVGPNRLHVRLARELAAAGYPTLRFDLSGRGDSDARRDGLSFLESSFAEIGAALNVMQKVTNAERFVLMGICSGAGNALQGAIADARVAGGVMIDGPAYPTAGFYLRYYARRLGHLESWRNTLLGRNTFGRRLRGLAPGRRAEDEDFGNPDRGAALPPKTQAAEALGAMVGRGVKLLFIFSGSWSIYNYRHQFRDAFPALMKRGGIDVEYFPNADHTFTRLHNQNQLIETIGRWMERLFPVSVPEEAAVAAVADTPSLLRNER